MRTPITLSLPVDLLVEARGAGLDGKFSKLLEEKIKEVLNKDMSEEELEDAKIEQLGELKKIIVMKSGLYPALFKQAVRNVKFRGIKANTLDEKITFWGMVSQEIKVLKESSPEPPKEKGV